MTKITVKLAHKYNSSGLFFIFLSFLLSVLKLQGSGTKRKDVDKERKQNRRARIHKSKSQNII
jgi:hypothetical protein